MDITASTVNEDRRCTDSELKVLDEIIMRRVRDIAEESFKEVFADPYAAQRKIGRIVAECDFILDKHGKSRIPSGFMPKLQA